jgi:chemotaxis signal transduction protein
MSRFLLVRVGMRCVGLALDEVEEIVDLGDTYAVPTKSPALRGIMPVNGRFVPVLHLASYLDDAGCPETRGAVGVLAGINGRKICLEVDDADTLVETELLPVPQNSCPFPLTSICQPERLHAMTGRLFRSSISIG